MVYAGSQAIVGPGFLIDYFDSGTDWVHVGEVKSITGPTETTDETDVTNQDSTGAFKEFKATLQDGGTVTADMHLLPGDAGQADLSDLKHARTIVPWRVRIPSTPESAIYFDGFINNLGFTFPLDAAAMRSFGFLGS